MRYRWTGSHAQDFMIPGKDEESNKHVPVEPGGYIELDDLDDLSKDFKEAGLLIEAPDEAAKSTAKGGKE